MILAGLASLLAALLYSPAIGESGPAGLASPAVDERPAAAAAREVSASATGIEKRLDRYEVGRHLHDAVLRLDEAVVSTHEATRHPQDGPDAEVRIQITGESVRFAIVLNLAFIDEIIDAPREDPQALHPVEHEAIRLGLGEYFKANNHVIVDGVEITPIDVGFETEDPDFSLLPLFPAHGARALIKVRLTLDYPLKSEPRAVEMMWGAYPPDAILATPEGTPPLEVTAQLLAAGLNSQVVFKHDEPSFTWHAPTEEDAEHLLPVPTPNDPQPQRLPLLSIVLLLGGVSSGLLMGFRNPTRRRRVSALAVLSVFSFGAYLSRDAGTIPMPAFLASESESLNAQQALEIFRPLHANIYRAFDYAAESDIYDALERSVHGDLLDSLYNEIYRSLIMQEEGGAVSRVEAVRPIETDIEQIGAFPPNEKSGFQVLARWQVDGAVHHWGHSHSRTNEYQARYVVTRESAGWRIASSQILEQFRVESAPLAEDAAAPEPDEQEEAFESF